MSDRITQKYLRLWPDSKCSKSWAGRLVHIQTENGVWRTNGKGYTYAGKDDAWVLPFEDAQKEVSHCGPEKQATFIAVTRPAAPVEGLETVEAQVLKDGVWQTVQPGGSLYGLRPTRGLVPRPQAEAIIAAKDAEIKQLKADLQTHIDGTTALVDEKIDAEFKAVDLAKDNAALTARVKELEAECNELVRTSNEVIGQRDHALNLCAQMEEDKEALETQLASARKALKSIADAPAWGFPEKWETTPAEVRQLARAALEGKP